MEIAIMIACRKQVFARGFLIDFYTVAMAICVFGVLFLEVFTVLEFFFFNGFASRFRLFGRRWYIEDIHCLAGSGRLGM